MSSIAINQTVEAALLKMMTSNAEDIVSKLASKYGFDPQEALQLTIPQEIVKKEVVHRKSKDDSISKSTKTKSKGKSKEDKPKKAKTGYLLFSDHVRADVRQELELLSMKDLQAQLSLDEEPKKLEPKHVVRGIAAKWAEQDGEEKDEWKDLAKANHSLVLSSTDDDDDDDDEDED